MNKIYVYQWQEVTDDDGFWYTRKTYSSLKKVEKALNRFPDMFNSEFDIKKARKYYAEHGSLFGYEFVANAIFERHDKSRYWKKYKIRIMRVEVE